MAALFAPDADFVDIISGWYKGRKDVDNHIAFLLGAVDKESVSVTLPAKFYAALEDVTYTFDSIDVRPINAGIVLAHIAWRQLGDPRFEDKPRQGLFTFVLVHDGDHWAINAGTQHSAPN